MKKKTNAVLWVFFFVLAGVLCGTPQKAKAAAGVVKLQTNKTYKSYDLDGDKKKDTLKMKTSRSGLEVRASIYVNGKKVYTLPKGYEHAGMRMVTLKNGKRFLHTYMEGAGVSYDKIFQYTNKKMKKIVDINNLMKKYENRSYIEQYPSDGILVNGNSIRIKVISMNWTLGGQTFVFEYKYKNNTLKRSSYSGEIEGKNFYTVDKEFPVYKKVGSSDVLFTASYGQFMTVDKYYVKDGSMWIRVTNSKGQSGWIEAATSAGEVFKNVQYAS